ncbi:MAG: hypothetical protein ACJAZO_004543 [Myxococcota bacterium]
MTERTSRRDRPEFTPAEATTPLWLDAFQFQVSARSIRLAGGFVGAEAPGRLHWSTPVSAGAGRVCDHELSPTGSIRELSVSERTCLLGVLSDPRYERHDANDSAAPAPVRRLIAY